MADAVWAGRLSSGHWLQTFDCRRSATKRSTTYCSLNVQRSVISGRWEVSAVRKSCVSSSALLDCDRCQGCSPASDRFQLFPGRSILTASSRLSAVTAPAILPDLPTMNIVGTETMPKSFASCPSLPPVSWICSHWLMQSFRVDSNCWSGNPAYPCHSRAGGNPERCASLIPAFAGLTRVGG